MSAPTPPDAAGGAASAAASPLLALLERLARTALAGAGTGGATLQLAGVEPAPDGATLLLRVQGMGGLLDTTLRLRVTIQEVGPHATRCTLSLPERGGLGRLLGGGLSSLPRPLLEQALARLGRHLGEDALGLDGDTLVLNHRALARHLRKRGET
jgi:hypothetical protein